MTITVDLAGLDPDVTVEPITAEITIDLNTIGVPGLAGQGVPAGGTTGQVLAKATDVNYDDEWVDAADLGELTNLDSRLDVLEAMDIVTYDGDGAVLADDGPDPADGTLATHLFVAEVMATGIAGIANAEAISFEPAGTIAADNVQAAIEEVAAEGGGGGGSAPFFIDGFGVWDGATVPTDTLVMDVIHPMFPIDVTTEAQTVTVGDRVMLYGGVDTAAFFTVTATGAWTALTPPTEGQFIVFDNWTFPTEAGVNVWVGAYQGMIFQIVDGELVRTSTPGLANLVAQYINDAGADVDFLNGGSADFGFADGGFTEAPVGNGLMVAEGWGWIGGVPGPATEGVTYQLEDPATVPGQFFTVKRTADPVDYPGPVIVDAWVTGTPTASGPYMIGGGTIDGAHTLELTQLNESITLYAAWVDGIATHEWVVISHVVEGATVDILPDQGTPTGGSEIDFTLRTDPAEWFMEAGNSTDAAVGIRWQTAPPTGVIGTVDNASLNANLPARSAFTDIDIGSPGFWPTPLPGVNVPGGPVTVLIGSGLPYDIAGINTLVPGLGTTLLAPGGVFWRFEVVWGNGSNAEAYIYREGPEFTDDDVGVMWHGTGFGDPYEVGWTDSSDLAAVLPVSGTAYELSTGQPDAIPASLATTLGQRLISVGPNGWAAIIDTAPPFMGADGAFHLEATRAAGTTTYAWSAYSAGGGAPSGPAGGALAGTYPDPSLADDSVTNAKLAEVAANTVKVNATGAAANPTDLTMGASTVLARLAAGNLVAATPAELRTLLALVVGTDVQAWDADLDTWATKAPPAGVVVGTTDTQTLTNKTLTAPAITSPTGIVKGDVGLGNVDNTTDANKPVSTAQQTALDAKQSLDAELTAIAGLTSAADRLPYFTGSAAAALATFTAAGRALVDDADVAAQLTTLGVSAFIQTLLDDADAATARTTLGVSGGGGMVYPKYTGLDYSNHVLLGTGAKALQRMYAAPFIVWESQAFDRITCIVTTGGTAGSVTRMGIYNDDGNGRPGTLALETAAKDTTGTGLISETISTTLAAGIYWVACVSQVAAPTLRTWAAGAPSWMGVTLGTGALDNYGWFQSSVSGALPNPWTSFGEASSSTHYPIAVWVRAA